MRFHFPFHSTQAAAGESNVAARCSVALEQQFPHCVVWLVSIPQGPFRGFLFNSECFQLKVCEEEPWRSMRNAYMFVGPKLGKLMPQGRATFPVDMSETTTF